MPGQEMQNRCSLCNQRFRVWSFPALARERRPPVEPTPAREGEAACFFHPGQQAVRPCDRCGRFLCALCELPLGSGYLCPACLGTEDAPVEIPELVSHRLSWPSLSMVLGLLPLTPLLWLFWPFFIVTGPAALFTAIYGWNKPTSLVNGSRRFSAVLGVIGSLLQIGVLVGIGIFIKDRIS